MKATVNEVLSSFKNKYVLSNQTSQDDSIMSGALLEITAEQIEELKKIHTDIYEYQLFERKVKEVELNLSSYFGVINYYENVLEKATTTERIRIQKDSYVDINRSLTNFISSFKSLIDDFLIKHQLPKIYGKPSSELEKFTNQTMDWYDSILAYKFLIRLRDYAIHYDFPIYTIDYAVAYNGKADKKTKVTCTPQFNKDKLLANSTFKSKLESDISSYNTKFPVAPFLHSIDKVIKRILPILVNLSNGRYQKSAEKFLSYYHKIPNPINVSFGFVTDELQLQTTILENEIANKIREY